MPRRRRGDRVQYPPTGSAFGNPTNAEKLARAVAIMTVGELTAREDKIAVELAHFFSAAIFDLEQENQSLHDKLMELARLLAPP